VQLSHPFKTLIALMALSIAAEVTAAPSASLTIEAIDVEGGAATLYITPEHRSLLIDTGWSADIGAKDPSSAERIVAAVRKHGLTKLDYVLITHYHVDHVGGLPQLLSLISVGTVLDHGPNRETPPPNVPAAYAAYQPSVLYPKYLEELRGHQHRTLKAGDSVRVGSLLLNVVISDGVALAHPLPGAGEPVSACAGMQSMDKDGGEENARSVAVVLSFGKARIASFGDLTWNMEQKLVCPNDKVGKVDLFFVSNHGTNLNNSPALLSALAPKVAIMGNGAKKGGDPESFDTVMASPRIARFWQLHFAERAGPKHNAPEAYIANPNADGDARASIEVQVDRSGALTVTNERTGLSETYAP